MDTKKWLEYHNSQVLLNAADLVRSQLRSGTYEGMEPIEDEQELDEKIAQAQADVEAYESAEENQGFFGWLFGK